jgi:TPR repeat protein
MYANGRGVPRDFAEAANWYRKAADRGDAAAQYNLGVAYDTGQGVPRNVVQAYRWYDVAATRFPSSAADNRAQAIKSRDLIAARMTPPQIAEAQKLAKEWAPR